MGISSSKPAEPPCKSCGQPVIELKERVNIPFCHKCWKRSAVLYSCGCPITFICEECKNKKDENIGDIKEKRDIEKGFIFMCYLIWCCYQGVRRESIKAFGISFIVGPCSYLLIDTIFKFVLYTSNEKVLMLPLAWIYRKMGAFLFNDPVLNLWFFGFALAYIQHGGKLLDVATIINPNLVIKSLEDFVLLQMGLRSHSKGIWIGRRAIYNEDQPFGISLIAPIEMFHFAILIDDVLFDIDTEGLKKNINGSKSANGKLKPIYLDKDNPKRQKEEVSFSWKYVGQKADHISIEDIKKYADNYGKEFPKYHSLENNCQHYTESLFGFAKKPILQTAEKPRFLTARVLMFIRYFLG